MTYENFIVPNIYWKYVLEQHRVSFINEYYKKHKNYPSDEILQEVVLTDEEKEKYKRIFYAQYKATGIVPSEPNIPQEPDTPIIPPTIEDGEFVEIPNNEIWYTTYDDEILIPSSLKNGYESNSIFGATLLRNIYENGIGKLIFDNDVTQIGHSAFANNSNLKTITIPNTVVSLSSSNGYGAFNSSGLESFISNPQKSQLKIAHYSFRHCDKLQKVVLSDICENLELAFDGCSVLEMITIPQNCTNISGSFSNCPKLKTIICKAMIAPTTDKNTFGNHDGWFEERCTGRDTYQNNTNTLLIYKDAIGYTEGVWTTRLLNKGQCGFHIEYID